MSLKLGFSLIVARWILKVSNAATVTGTLTDISLNALNTKLLFTPTNTVLINASGLSAGPAKIVESSAGSFSIPLDTGDYTVSLPLITLRRPFRIAVPDTTATINITNVMNPPVTYVYTNQFVSTPLHVNTASVVAWSTNGETTLLDTTIPARNFFAGNVLAVEAFGTFSDPGENSPPVTFQLKLGGTTVLSHPLTGYNDTWHLRILLTIRSGGVTSTVAVSSILTPDVGFPAASGLQTATIGTTSPLTLDLTGEITNFAGTEAITVDQLLITLQ
jgi:hypothetical protein